MPDTNLHSFARRRNCWVNDMAMYQDPIVEETHKTREKLLEQYGGSEGFAEHLKEVENDMKDRVVSRKRREPVQGTRRAS
jgi:hypothetical protein